MKQKEYEDTMIVLLKQIKKITDEYCGGECEYLAMFISQDIIMFNNAHWEGKEPKISVYHGLKEEDDE